MLMIFPVYGRIDLLPYFLKYYSSLGVSQFVCGLYDGKKNPSYEQILSFRSQYRLIVRPSVDSTLATYNPVTEAHGLNVIRMEFMPHYPWYAIADLDEFHCFSGKSLPKVALQAESLACDAVHGVFVDRIAADGSFPKISGILDDVFPLACNLTHCFGGCCRKIVLARSRVKISSGHHRANGRIWYNAAEVHHFKWHYAIHEVIHDCHKRYQKQGLRWAMRELPLAKKLISEKIDLHNKRLRVRQAAILGI
jgi:hypothetical protein